MAFDFAVPRRRVANNIAMSSLVNRCREKSFCDFHDRFTPASLAGTELSADQRRVRELVYQPAINTAGDSGAISFERVRDCSRKVTLFITIVAVNAPQRTNVTGSELPSHGRVIIREVAGGFQVLIGDFHRILYG